jgi:aryl-alcohol dehydrogenase-like predicted oxidoreductase
MKYKSFGKTGVKVSELIFGTWYLPSRETSGKREVNRQTSIKLIKKAYDLGINFFDTADVYRGIYDRDTFTTNFENVGLAEKIVGEALKGYDRESFVISTKVMGRTGPLPNDLGANRKHVRSAIAKSLERLKLKYVDFYMVHGPDEDSGIEQTAKTMNILEDEGLILHYGISNHSAHSIIKFLNLRYFEPLEPPAFIQDKYNLIERELENTNIKVAEDNSLASMIYSPLAQGVLAGRYIKENSRDSRKEYERWFEKNQLQAENQASLEKFSVIAKQKDVTMSQLALCWLINRGKYIFPILGATREEQLEENVGSGNISLSAQDADDLGKLFEGKKK